VAETEASIRTVSKRHAERSMKLWVNLRTLLDTNPLSKLNTRQLRRFASPLQKIAQAHRYTPTDRMGIIRPYVITPWEERLVAKIDPEKAIETANATQGICIATSSSGRKGMVGMGGAIYDTLGIVTRREPITYAVTLGARTEQNPYIAELAAMARAMGHLPQHLVGREITIFTSNLGALLAASQPRHQSGQASIEEMYNAARALRKGSNSISLVWVPSQGDFDLSRRANEAARRAAEHGQSPEAQHRQAKSTVINNARAKREIRILPEEVGKYSKEVDAALPGKHTRTLYDSLKRREASVLAKLRTGMARLNGYLHQIGASESDLCICGQGRETVKHFLFRCARWDAQRTEMLAQTDTRRGKLSYYLGGKAPSDPETWAPNMDAVRATIKYAIATGRLNTETEQTANTQQQ
jgi:ribonuclease HI